VQHIFCKTATAERSEAGFGLNDTKFFSVFVAVFFRTFLVSAYIFFQKIYASTAKLCEKKSTPLQKTEKFCIFLFFVLFPYKKNRPLASLGFSYKEKNNAAQNLPRFARQLPFCKKCVAHIFCKTSEFLRMGGNGMPFI
jgi:hypothetical protein